MSLNRLSLNRFFRPGRNDVEIHIPGLRGKSLTALFVFCILISQNVTAQLYTLQYGQRESTFYYWGRHWIDQCTAGDLGGIPFVPRHSPIVLRFCTTDDSLRIIGIAGCCANRYDEFRNWYSSLGGMLYNDTAVAHRLPEYFQLYKATSSDPVLLAETRWDTAHPRYQVSFYYDRVYENERMSVYEAFFDRPIVVRDSFFVGGTCNNNYYYYDPATSRYRGYEFMPTCYLGLTKWIWHTDNTLGFPCPMTPHRQMTVKYFPQRYTNVGQQSIMDEIASYDTNWHVNGYDDGGRYMWPCFFPIIDTTGMGLDGFQWLPGYGCDSVRTFHVLYVEGRSVYLSWNANNDAQSYEVSYGPEGTGPEQGIKVQFNTSMATLEGLEPGRRYVAYVRARCADNARSVWTGGVTFQIPASASSIEDASLAGRFTAVMPNPATTQATVASSFAIHRIELYTVAGRHLQTTEPRGYMAAVDLAGLPAGAYLVRVQTAAGETIKKLVKR